MASIFLVRRRYRQGLPKRQALLLLANYEQQYVENKDPVLISSYISELLKRVALVYFPRADVAGLNGKTWVEFLNSTAKNINFNDLAYYFLELPYRTSAADVNLKPLFVSAKAWITQRGAPCLN